MIPRYTRPAMGAVWSDQHRYELMLEIEIAVTVVGALAIDVIVDHTEQRFVGECRDRNVDDLPSGHVTSTATTVHAHCI